MIDTNYLKTREAPNWCPGCGNFSILVALKAALAELGLKPHEVVLTSGIGCSSKDPQWVRTYGFNGLHGRPLPLAEGVQLTNHELRVIACGGDGDGYAEGTNHFIHFCRSNINMAYFVHNNQIYALTKGQASPTSDEGFITKTTPYGVIEKSINPVLLALSAGATFIARGFAGDVKHLKGLMKKAITHKGAAVLDIMQPCITFNHVNTYAWYSKRVYKLKEPLPTRRKAIKRAMEWGKRIPIGVFYKVREKTYQERYPVIKKVPLIKQKMNINITKLMQELK